MLEHFQEIIIVIVTGIGAAFLRRAAKEIEKRGRVLAGDHKHKLVDAAVDTAVKAIEEEVRVSTNKDKPAGLQKRSLAVGMAGMILNDEGVSTVPALLIGKVDAKVRDLFNKDK